MKTVSCFNLIPVIFCASLFVLFSMPVQASHRIIVDGEFSDWDTVPVAYLDPTGDQQAGSLDFTEIKITNDERFLFISLDVTEEINIQANIPITIYMDTDNNAATGDLINGIGADLIWEYGEKSGLFHTDIATYDVYHAEIGMITLPSVTSTRYEITLDRTMSHSGRLHFPSSTVKFVIKDHGSGQDMIPDSGEELTYTFDENPPPALPVISLSKDPQVQVRVLSYNVHLDDFFETSLFPLYSRILTALQPDIIGFQEIYDHSAQETADRVESMIPSGPGEQWYYSKTYPDIILVSRYPILYRAPVDGNSAFLVDTMAVSGKEFLLVVAHLPAGDNEYDRQLEVDRLMAQIRDAKETGGSMGLDPFTPYAIMGDMNFVGDAAQLNTMITGDIVNSEWGPSFDPDWDDTPLFDAKPRLTEAPLCYTWYNSYSYYWPGRLDFFIYSDSVMAVPKTFVLDTMEMSEDELSQWGLSMFDSRSASDHQPLIADCILNPDMSTPTPGTPLPTPSPTIVPTDTPQTPIPSPTSPASTPTPIPGVPSIDLSLSQNVFSPGDPFVLEAMITNPGSNVFTDQPLVILLDAHGNFFWYPAWSTDFSVELITVPAGVSNKEILNFEWPTGTGSESGILFYGAMLTQDMTAIFGNWDFITFGWTD